MRRRQRFYLATAGLVVLICLGAILVASARAGWPYVLAIMVAAIILIWLDSREGRP